MSQLIIPMQRVDFVSISYEVCYKFKCGDCNVTQRYFYTEFSYRSATIIPTECIECGGAIHRWLR